MEKESLREHFRNVGSVELRPSLLQRDGEANTDRKLWRKIAEAGLFARRDGFLSTQAFQFCESIIGLAHGSFDVPFCSSLSAHWLVTALIQQFGSSEHQLKYLAKMRRGELIGAICNAEDTAGSQLKRIRSNLAMNSNGSGFFKAHKPLVTNVPIADIFVVSALVSNGQEPPQMELFLLDRDQVKVTDGTSNLSCFRTSPTGSLTAEIADFRPEKYRLVSSEKTMAFLTCCFDLERILVPSVMIGALYGAEEIAFSEIERRKQLGNDLSSKQYVQQKVLQIYMARTKMEALSAFIFSGLKDEDLRAHNGELALLKMICIKDGLTASLCLFELMGFGAIDVNHPAQKLVRDVAALRYFGGTLEQQKMTIFHELYQGFLARNDRKMAA